MTEMLEKLPDLAVLYRTHVAAQLLQGFDDGCGGPGLTALTEWALHGRMILADRADLVFMFAAPHRAALEESDWKGDPVAEAEADLAREEARAAAFDNATPTHAALGAIATERLRQIRDEGWTPEHDDSHSPGALAYAAANYAQESGHQASAEEKGYAREPSPSPPFLSWPWSLSWWKPSDPDRNLVKAGALILAELERRARARRSAETEAGQ